MTTHDKKTPEEATLGAGAPGDPTRPAHDEAQRYLDVPVAYEKTDVATRPVIKVAAVLGIVSVLAVALTYGVFRLYGTLAEKGDPPAPPLARAAGRQFPEPRLQTTPVQDYRALAAQDAALLEAAGWADEAGGVARIPIDDAIVLAADAAAAGRPLPMARVAAPASPAPGSPAPGATPASPAAPAAAQGAHR